MNCSKCGAQLADGAKFCVTCGTPVAETPVTPVAPQAAQAAPQQAKPATDVKGTLNGVADKLTDSVNKATKKNFKKPAVLGVCCGAVVLVVVLLIVIIANIAGGAYKKPIKNFAAGIKSGSEKKIACALAPKKALDGDYDVADSFIDEDIQKFDAKILYKHKVTSKDDREDYIENSYLARVVDEDADDIKIKDMYKVVVHFDVKEDGEKSCSTMEMVVGKYKGSWYILSLYGR